MSTQETALAARTLFRVALLELERARLALARANEVMKPRNDDTSGACVDGSDL